METVEFLGITFRSSGHLGYFLMNCFVLLLFMVIGLFSRRFLEIVLPAMSLSYVFSSFIALVFTKGKNVVGPYSPDCVWFNALMAIIFFLFFVSVKLLNKRGKKAFQKTTS